MGVVVRAGIFARAPLPGRTKTRLIPELGAEPAAELHAAFIADGLTHLSALGKHLRSQGTALRITLWSAEGEQWAKTIAETHAAEVSVQRGEDLGERMASALTESLKDADLAFLVGSDAPTLGDTILLDWVERMLRERADIGFVPSADGGYCLVGASKRGIRIEESGPSPPDLSQAVFDRMPWSTPDVMRTTLLRIRALEPSVRLVKTLPWYDVDDAEGLRLLCSELAIRPERAPKSRQVLSALGRLDTGSPDEGCR